MHNVVVCTLCSCYPWPVLGLPPTWYKSPPYRARMVREPRALLAEMGCAVADDVEIRVWDSSAEVRYLVLPERPAGTDGASEDELAALRHARRDDRRRPAVTDPVAPEVHAMTGTAALPRHNGELAFDAPWEGRVVRDGDRRRRDARAPVVGVPVRSSSPPSPPNPTGRTTSRGSPRSRLSSPSRG